MRKRLWQTAIITFAALMCAGLVVLVQRAQVPTAGTAVPQANPSGQAADVLNQLPVKPAASKAGYSRGQFSEGWESVGTCTIRDKILARDMTNVTYESPTDCTVETGTLNDPYTGKIIHFVRGPSTSTAVQIDHVVAVSDAWQTGAQLLTKEQRHELYNDPLELLAVDGPANDEKSDSDAAGWLPPNKPYDCRYVARQIAVKQKYHLWVTASERAAMQATLATCPGQTLQ